MRQFPKFEPPDVLGVYANRRVEANLQALETLTRSAEGGSRLRIIAPVMVETASPLSIIQINQRNKFDSYDVAT